MSRGPAGYPASPADRTRWIRGLRPARNTLDPRVPYAFLHETEPAPGDAAATVNTLFLTNRECPWTCLMCDLWRNTVEETVPPGAITAQIGYALARLPSARHIKLYNAGSFFDRKAIPLAEHAGIAGACAGFERVIVECHPALIDSRILAFRDRLPGRLEIAVGLETAHPAALSRLNKGITLDNFARAGDFLRGASIPMRTFILVNPPFVPDAEGLEWAKRSVDAAFDAGAETVVLIPTRAGNGAMEVLAASGDFTPPALETMEAALAYALGLSRGRALLDLWDIDLISRGEPDFASRLARIKRMIDTQRADA